jgi:hypothetical protein
MAFQFPVGGGQLAPATAGMDPILAAFQAAAAGQPPPQPAWGPADASEQLDEAAAAGGSAATDEGAEEEVEAEADGSVDDAGAVGEPPLSCAAVWHDLQPGVLLSAAGQVPERLCAVSAPCFLGCTAPPPPDKDPSACCAPS